MNFEEMLSESLGGIALYAIFRLALINVESGKATNAEKNLVDNFNQVLAEYKNKALLEKMQAEAAEIDEKKRNFERKWGVLLA